MTSSHPRSSQAAPFQATCAQGELCIRPATLEDAERIALLAREADMGELSARGITWAAECSQKVVGFIRLLEDRGQWYVNPVVVDPAYRRKGVGAALMAFAHKRYGELRFVARGYAVPFYEALGCENVPWDAIAPIVADDCDECSMLATCHPQPMCMR